MIKFNFDWDLAGAEREIKEALRLNPSFAQAHQYYSGILTTMKRVGTRRLRRRGARWSSIRSAPTARRRSASAITTRIEPAEAIAAVHRRRSRSRPDFPWRTGGWRSVIACRDGSTSRLDQLRSAVQLSGNSAYMRAHLAYGYAVAGDRARAEALAEGDRGGGAGRRYVAPYHIALIAAGLGETDEAVRWLREARSRIDRVG